MVKRRNKRITKAEMVVRVAKNARKRVRYRRRGRERT